MKKGINLNSFKQKNFIYFENIQDGFDKFNHICFTSDFTSFKNFVYEVIKSTKGEKFFDFYFANLNETSKNKILEYSTKHNINLTKEFEFSKNHIYYNVDDFNKEILDFILQISFDETLFSTFYFSKPYFTIWTNYDKKFVLFGTDKQDLLTYKNIAEKLNLQILFEKL